MNVIRVVVIVLALSPLGLAVPHLIRTAGEGDEMHGTGRRAAPADAGAVAPVLGCAIVAHHIGDLDLYLESVDRIAGLGANSLVVVTPMFQETVDSREIRYLPDRCPTDEQLVAILLRARRRGLLTALQPIVLIENPGEDDWRGVIRPGDWDAWWTSYRSLIDRFLSVAEEGRVDLFTIGSELNSTEDQVQRWGEIAERARARFPGRITYSANWDRYEKVKFWPLVDAISVSSYFELRRSNPSAAEAELIEDWVEIRDGLLAFAADWERPLLLSEVGYPSLPWASAHPWNYVAGGAGADHAAQARCYRAFFSAWSDTVASQADGAMGFFCYHWDPYRHGDDADTGYGIRGKPAYSVVRKGFESIRARSAPD